LKNWVIYEHDNGNKKEKYTFQNAKLKKEENGDVDIYCFGEKEWKNI